MPVQLEIPFRSFQRGLAEIQIGHLPCPVPGGIKRKSPGIGKHVQDLARVLRQFADPGTVFPLVEEKSRLLSESHIGLEHEAVFQEADRAVPAGFAAQDPVLVIQPPLRRQRSDFTGKPDRRAFQLRTDGKESRQHVFQMRQPRGGIDFHRQHIGITVGRQSGKAVRFAVGKTPCIGVGAKQSVTAGSGFFRKTAEEFRSDVRCGRAESQHPQPDLRIGIGQSRAELPLFIKHYSDIAGFQIVRDPGNGIFEDPGVTRPDRLQSFGQQMHRGDPGSPLQQSGHLRVCRVRRNVPRPQRPL